ncbi:MAG: orotate phosphoribosyltransferase [Prevotellaceae bacterium]|nr:orotate phosphoribosyltransferase [Prevotellaceae bacterium]
MAREIARNLLQIKAIKLNPANPFTWASGWNSPIYCDNRKTLSYPAVRKLIYESFAKLIAEKYPDVDVIAGVATGAIAHGILVAENMGKPFVYVRSTPKLHGLENLIEGDLPEGKKTIVIEDLISTGGSSLAAVEALRKAGVNVLGLAAIFTYNFEAARQNFKTSGCACDTLSNYPVLIEEAIASGYVQESDLDTLQQWRKSPCTWRK